MSTGSRRVVILTALALALVGQGAGAFLIRPEPYPTVKLPAFGRAATSTGLFPARTLDITIGYVDGSVRHPDVVELMGRFRFSAARTSAEHVFGPESNRGPVRPVDEADVRAWLADRARVIGHGAAPAYAEFCFRDGQLEISTARYVRRGGCETTRVPL